jgi:pyruvate,water dikinase
MGFLIRFGDERALDPQIVGHKFSALARAFRAGFAVPQAVAISTKAHQYYQVNDRWPEGLVEAVLNSAVVQDISQGLSIRSSATREDLEKQSFAGQYRSFLQVVNKDDLKNSIEACWKCVDSRTVQSYLKARNLSDQHKQAPLMAVVIQKMVDAIAAGIAFGRNPMKPARSEIVIEAVKGLAEDLVNGHRTPYRAVVNENGTVNVTAPPFKTSRVDETDRLLHLYPFWRDIAQLVMDLESHRGEKPLDIEWAVDDQKKIWLLQSRTITTLDDPGTRIPPGLWTRKIANDLWADRLTPFLAHHMEKTAPRFDLSRALKILGVPITRPTLKVIHGYLYINCKNINTGIAHLPPKLRLSELNHLLPPSARAAPPSSPSYWKIVLISLRSILLFILQPSANPFICHWRAKHNLKAINRKVDRVFAMPDNSPRLTMDKIQAALETLTRLQMKNQWPYFFATFMTWILRWFAINRLDLSHADFLYLLSENANNISIDIEQNFRKAAQEIVRHKDLADMFQNSSAALSVEDLPPAIRIDLNNFLSLYGCRSRHRTLFIKRWSESPEEVIGILQSLVRNQLNPTEALQNRSLPEVKPDDTQPTESATGGKSSSFADSLLTSDGGGLAFSRLFLRLLTRLTRQFLDLREDLRFALDRILFLIRRTLLTLGEQTGLGEKVMFLTDDELKNLVLGKFDYIEAKRSALYRYNEFSRPFDVATFYNEGLAEDDFQIHSNLIRGIGTSPGRVSGRAKIVDDPAQVDIKTGDILIAKNTDPGWTPILRIIGGMVMEEGGLLNHCSIVARELGIPSIVGVHQATRRIQDNDLITIDGGLGVVIIEE